MPGVAFFYPDSGFLKVGCAEMFEIKWLEHLFESVFESIDLPAIDKSFGGTDQASFFQVIFEFMQHFSWFNPSVVCFEV